MSCQDCGALITITNLYDLVGGCLQYVIEGSYASGAVSLQVICDGCYNGSDNGILSIEEIPCGESVTIQLINDQACVSAQVTVNYDCCGTACTLQTVEIDTATCDGNRIFSIEGEAFTGSCNLGAYAIVESADGSFITRWDDIVADIYAVLTNPACTIINECCTLDDLEVSWSNVGDIVTISIINSPVSFSHLVISGAPCAGNIYFDHSACNYQMKSCLFYSDGVGGYLNPNDMDLTYMGNTYVIPVADADYISIGAYTYNQAFVDAINAAAIPGFSASLPTESEITANPYSLTANPDDYATTKTELIRLRWVDGKAFTLDFNSWNAVITETNSHTILSYTNMTDLAPVGCVYE